MFPQVRCFAALAWLLPAAGLMAQTGSIRGPVSGVVYDGAERAIRPMMGVPGAAYLGAPIAGRLDFASVAPDGGRALAVTGGRLFLLRGLNAGAVRWVPLEDESAVPMVAWRADSAAAVVWSPAGNRIRLWSALSSSDAGSPAPPNPRAGSRSARVSRQDGPELTELGRVAGTVTALGVDSRDQVVFGIDGEGLYLAAAGRAPSLIAPMTRPSAIAFALDDRLYATDQARGEVLEVSRYGESPDVTLLATADRAVADPIGAALSADGRSLMVAGAASRKVVFLDRATRAASATVDLDFEPSGIEHLSGGLLFLLKSRRSAGETLQVLEASRQPAVYFVPAASIAAAGSASSQEE
jgi:hypothetical protein